MAEQERDDNGRFSGSGGSGAGGAASKDEARQASGKADAKSKVAFRGANIREKHNDAANAHREAADPPAHSGMESRRSRVDQWRAA